MSKKQKSNYSELLQDPRWQKKRVEVLLRDEFRCQHCGSKEETLHVHHLRYEKGKMPWEYDNGELITLCHRCHEAESKANQDLYEDFKWLKEMWKELGLSNQMLSSLLGTMSSYLEDMVERKNNNGFTTFERDDFREIIFSSLFGCQRLNDFAKALEYGFDFTKEIESNIPELKDAWNEIKRKKYGNDI